MNRYVVLRHECPPEYRPSHWDLMLEHEGVLRTWAVPIWPIGPEPVSAEALPDHRLDYLTYEGPISGGRGEVRRVERGAFDLLFESSGVVLVELVSDSVQRSTLSLKQTAGQRWQITLQDSDA